MRWTWRRNRGYARCCVGWPGTGILLVTHHIADILPEIGRVILMQEGRIVADGKKEKLLTAPVLSELFGAEVRVMERDGFYHAW
jgi:iron complex transport system ATP-binding protein